MADRSNGCWLRQSIDTLTHGQMIAVQSTPSIMWMERAIRIPCRRPECTKFVCISIEATKKQTKLVLQRNKSVELRTLKLNAPSKHPTDTEIQNARRPRIAKSVHSFLLLLLLLSPTKYKTSRRKRCSIGIWRRRLMEHLPVGGKWWRWCILWLPHDLVKHQSSDTHTHTLDRLK